ncbi:MAG TPA: RodZ domain-containing protein [Nitrospirota bacterium]|nr:RodZ domain-containing protein [Nitrospirota bacterium]
MGTLGKYLRDAREAMGIDIRDAAMQTRISVNYLHALEEEDFSKLPGEVFVKGFLKNYGRFLHLEEAEVLKRYAALKPQTVTPPAPPADGEKTTVISEQGKVKKAREAPIEPFVWGAAIFILLIVFLLTSMPTNKHTGSSNVTVSAPTGTLQGVEQFQARRPDKLYLEVVALEDTWLLVRTDSSPQKKAVLKKGESLIWSADDMFLLSYSDVSAVRLLLNGEELAVKGTRGTVIRDLAITRAGITNQPLQVKQPRPTKPKPKPEPQHEVSPQQAEPEPQPEPQPEPLVKPLPPPVHTPPVISPFAPPQ